MRAFFQENDVLDIFPFVQGRVYKPLRSETKPAAERIKIRQQRFMVFYGQDTALSEPRAAALKLRFEENERPAAFRKQFRDRRQDEF